MSEMTLQQTRERFTEGLKRAESCAREMYALQQLAHWKLIADSLLGMRIQGEKMIHAKALTEVEIEKIVSERVKSLDVNDISVH